MGFSCNIGIRYPVLLTLWVLCLSLCRADPESGGEPAGEAFDLLLHAMERVFKDVPPEERHQAPRYVLSSAAFALAARQPDAADGWRHRLFKDGTPASDAFGIFQDVLQGRWDNMFDLCQLLPQAHWRGLAHWLNERAKWMPTPQQWRDGAVALSLLDVCAQQGRSYDAYTSLKIINEAPEELQRRLMQVVLLAAKSGEHEAPLSRLRATLRGAVRYGRLKNAEWCATLTDITTDADEHGDLLDALGDARMNDLAESMAVRAASAHPTDPDVAVAAFDALLRAGKGKSAFSVVLDAEQAVPYPGRRSVRLHYLGWLHLASRGSSGRQGVPEGMMSFREEREDRLHAAMQAEDVEAQMAVGDVHAVARENREADYAYRTAWQRSKDPVVKWTAWLAWAEFDAGGAWHQRDVVEKLVGTGETERVDGYTFLSSCIAVGLASGEIEATQQWADKRLNNRVHTNEIERLIPAVAALSWALGREQESRGLLKSVNSAGLREQAVRLVLALSHGLALEPDGLPPRLTPAVSRELAARFNQPDCCSRGVRLAVEQMASYPSIQSVTSTWEVVTTGLPETRMEPLQQDLQRACLDWLDRHPDDLAAVIEMMRAAASHLTRGGGSRALRDAGPLFVECLGRAARDGVPSAQVRVVASAFAERLKKDKEVDGTGEAVRMAIVQHYPDLAKEIGVEDRSVPGD